MKPPAGLIALLGKPSSSDDEEEAPMSESGGGIEKEYAREAFAALKDDDEEGFVSAILSAVRSCARKGGMGDKGLEDDDSY